MPRHPTKRKRRPRGKKKDVRHVGRITLGVLAGFAAAGVLAFFGTLWLPVYAADGSGSMVVVPESVVAGSTGNTLTFTFTADEVMDSGAVTLAIPAGWSGPQGTAGVAGYTTASSDGMVAKVEDAAEALDGWAAGSACGNGIALDGGVYHEGRGAIRCDNRDEEAGDVWYRNIPTVPEDWSEYTEVGFWIRSSVKFESGVLVFSISDRTDLGNQIERLSFPDSISADTWTYVNLRFESHPGDRRSIESYGFMINDGTILDDASIWVDDLLIGPGVPTFPTISTVRANLLRLGSHQTVTITYGAGGGASGATATSTPGTSTFLTRTRVSDAGRLTAIAVSPVVTVTAPVAAFQLTDPGDMTAGTRLAYAVSRVDQDGNPVTTGTHTVYLYTNSSGSGSHFYDAASGGSAITSRTIGPGASSAAFWYADDTAGTWTVTASDNAAAPDGAVGIDDVADAVTVSAAPTPPPSSAPPSSPSDPTLEVPNEIVAYFEEGSCSPDAVATLHVHAHSTSGYRIGPTADLSGLPWLNFDGTEVHTDIAFPDKDGTYARYFQLRSPSLEESPVQEVSIRVDTTNGCVAPPHEHELRDGRIVAPYLDEACIADFAHASLVPYLVTPDGSIVKPGMPGVATEELSASSLGYTFTIDGTETVMYVERVLGKQYVHIHAGGGPYELRATVLAGDIPIDDVQAWKDVSGLTHQSVTYDVDAYPEICSAEQVYHPHPGTLVRVQFGPVSYLGTDFQRHTFPDASVLASWYGEAPQVRTWPSYRLARYPLGKNVTLKPASGIVQVRTTSDFHLLAQQRTLRRVLSDGILSALFGPGWAQTSVWLVDVLYFGDYTIGKNVADVRTVEPVPADITIDQELGLPSLAELLSEQPAFTPVAPPDEAQPHED